MKLSSLKRLALWDCPSLDLIKVSLENYTNNQVAKRLQPLNWIRMVT